MGKVSLVALTVAAMVLGAAALVPPTTGSPARPAADYSLSVIATTDYHYQPETFQQVPTDTNITVTFTDADVLSHSFTISSREGFVIPSTYSPAQLDQMFVTYPAIYSSLLNGSGDQSVGTFQSPATPGWYEFVCTVSGHFQNGMYGFIAFGENLPANLTTPNRTGLGSGNVSPIEAAGIGIGVIAVLVLGYLVWVRRQSPPKRPPTSSRGAAPPPAGPPTR